MKNILNIKEDVVNELHKPARKNYRRRRVITRGLTDLWQADLVEMIPYAKFNQGHRYILVVINVFSKFVWTQPVKKKTAADVTHAMQTVIQEAGYSPNNIQTDMGTEFYNNNFQQLMKSNNINHYSSYSNLKASIVERVNRTLKNLMWKQFSLQGNYKWLKLLPQIVFKYNNTKHRTIGMRPIDVTPKNAMDILKSVFTHIKIIDPKGIKFRVGDSVRISKHREAFTKGYTPNWSNEIFTIRKVHMTNPTTYFLKDSKNEEIKGSFYEQELQKVKHPDVYLVEKVIRRKGNQLYVKWLGLDNTHNSWIAKSLLV